MKSLTKYLTEKLIIDPSWGARNLSDIMSDTIVEADWIRTRMGGGLMTDKSVWKSIKEFVFEKAKKISLAQMDDLSKTEEYLVAINEKIPSDDGGPYFKEIAIFVKNGDKTCEAFTFSLRKQSPSANRTILFYHVDQCPRGWIWALNPNNGQRTDDVKCYIISKSKFEEIRKMREQILSKL